MKKLFSLTLALLLLLFTVTGCGNDTDSTPDDTTEKEVSSQDAGENDAKQEDTSKTKDVTPSPYEWPITAKDFEDCLNEGLLKDPKISDIGEYGNIASCNANTYDLGDGASLVIYTNQETDYIAGFFVTYDNQLVSESSMKNCTDTMLGITALFTDDLESTANQLFSNMDAGAYQAMNIGGASLMFTVNDTAATFMATPFV